MSIDTFANQVPSYSNSDRYLPDAENIVSDDGAALRKMVRELRRDNQDKDNRIAELEAAIIDAIPSHDYLKYLRDEVDGHIYVDVKREDLLKLWEVIKALAQKDGNK